MTCWVHEVRNEEKEDGVDEKSTLRVHLRPIIRRLVWWKREEQEEGEEAVEEYRWQQYCRGNRRGINHFGYEGLRLPDKVPI